MPAGTFGITLGIAQGTDHHFSTGQAVAGVQIAQVALGVEFTGFNDLEKVRSRVRLYRAGGLARLPSPILLFYLWNFLLFLSWREDSTDSVW